MCESMTYVTIDSFAMEDSFLIDAILLNSDCQDLLSSILQTSEWHIRIANGKGEDVLISMPLRYGSTCKKTYFIRIWTRDLEKEIDLDYSKDLFRVRSNFHLESLEKLQLRFLYDEIATCHKDLKP